MTDPWLRIDVLSGAEKGLSAELREERITLGRGLEAQLRLDSPRVSRVHLVLERSGRHCLVASVHPRNPSRMGGRTLQVGQRLPLPCQLELADTRVRVEGLGAMQGSGAGAARWAAPLWGLALVQLLLWGWLLRPVAPEPVFTGIPALGELPPAEQLPRASELHLEAARTAARSEAGSDRAIEELDITLGQLRALPPGARTLDAAAVREELRVQEQARAQRD